MLLRRRFRRRPPAVAVLGLALVVVVGARLAYRNYFPSPGGNPPDLLHEGPCEIVKVLDGQTLFARQTTLATDTSAASKSVVRQVRLIGIEADDPRAAELLTSLVADKDCRLKFDKRRIDRQQRLLAYVYAGNVLLNEQLVEEGLARAKDYPGDSASIAKRIHAAERRAKADKRGLWSAGNL